MRDLKMKTFVVYARYPLTPTARNAGATGRKYWWAFARKIKARNAKHACSLLRKEDYAYVEKLRAHLAD